MTDTTKEAVERLAVTEAAIALAEKRLIEARAGQWGVTVIAMLRQLLTERDAEKARADKAEGQYRASIELQVEDHKEHCRIVDDLQAQLTAANEKLASAREVLRKCQQFIENGIEFGFINMPEDKSDPAHDTLPAIRAALATHPTTPASHEGQS